MTIGGLSLARAWWACAVALTLGAPGASGQVPPGGPPPPIFTPDWTNGTFNRDALAGFFRAAAIGRVDIVCIGDSNQLLWGRGWDEAYIRYAGFRWRLYATGLVSGGENFGSGAGVGFDYSGVFPPPSTGYVSAASGPASLFMNAADLLQPLNALSVGPGVSADPFANLGMVLHSSSDLDTSGPLRYWVAHATYPVGTGSTLRLSARLNDPPYSDVVAPKAIDTATGQGAAVNWLDLPMAGPRGTRGSLNVRPTQYGVPFTGPMSVFYGRIEDPRVKVGASVHVLYALGGQSARDMGAALRAASDESLTLYFSMVRALQGPDKAILVRIGTGVNDRSETAPPLEPTGQAPNAPASFAANLRAVVERVRQVWSLNGWPQEELYFLFAVSTPLQGPPDDSLLQDYRLAADGVALEVPRAAVTHFERLTSVKELKDQDWVLFDIDTAHLEAGGHAAMAQREMSSATYGRAWVDVNADGRIDAEDAYADHAMAGIASTAGAPGWTIPPPTPPAGSGLGEGPIRPQAPGAPVDPGGGDGVAELPPAGTARALLRAIRWGEDLDLAAGRTGAGASPRGVPTPRR